MRNNLSFFSAFIIFLVVAGLQSFKPKNNRDLPLPTGYNSLFSGSGECVMCHNSMVDQFNNHIGIPDYWKSTMMGNASKDPFWRAKVSYEVIKNPALQEEIETTCTRCHAPQGTFNAFHNGQNHYSMDEVYNDPIANDGVSCTVCHQISDESLNNYSGDIVFSTNHEIFGPYSNIFPNPMIQHTGYTPVYGNHIKNSELCANCHTLLTPTIDLNGEPTGTYFVEQAIYQEWKNSLAYENQMTCQKCHIPEIDEPVVISTMPSWLEGQSPFGKHELAGANVFMLNILKNNIDNLGLTASEEDFDATISRVLHKLQEESINLNLNLIGRTNDTLIVKVTLENRAGHKVPAGYPSRQMFVQLAVTDENQDTVFISGGISQQGQIIHEALPYEPHHNIITSENQTQIYQMVMADIEGNVTTTLLHAHHAVKDNRLVPMGFSKTHPSYDTIAILGNALADENFNFEENGSDEIFYHIPVGSYSGDLSVTVKVFYQTVSQRWLDEMFSHSSAEIDSFYNMYSAADLQPVLMQASDIVSHPSFIEPNAQWEDAVFYPNPVHNTIYIKNHDKINSLSIFTLNGKQVVNHKFPLPDFVNFNYENGIYLLVWTDLENNQHAKKIIKY